MSRLAHLERVPAQHGADHPRDARADQAPDDEMADNRGSRRAERLADRNLAMTIGSISRVWARNARSRRSAETGGACRAAERRERGSAASLDIAGVRLSAR
jgi:hypothetical protein